MKYQLNHQNLSEEEDRCQFFEKYDRLRSLLIKPAYNKKTGKTDFINGNPSDKTAVEDFLKLMGDIEFFQQSFKYLDRYSLNDFLISYAAYFDFKNLIVQGNIDYIGIYCPSLFAFKFFKEVAEDDCIMKKIASQPGISPIITSYCSDKLRQDEEFNNLVKANSEKTAILTGKDLIIASMGADIEDCMDVDAEISKLQSCNPQDKKQEI